MDVRRTNANQKKGKRKMAKVTFNPDQPIQALSGTVGNLTYRTMNGKTYVYRRNAPELRENATRKERAAYKERMIVDACVKIIQDEMEDFVEALQSRQAIRAAMKRYYRLYSPEIKARTKLQGKMLSAYRKRKHREWFENGPTKPR